MSATEKAAPTIDKDAPKYPHNVLEAFGLGALLDLRVRMAFNFMQHSPAVAEVTKACIVNLPEERAAELPVWVGKFCLAVADEILKQGLESGLVQPLPDASDTSIDDQLRAQAARTATYSVLQQIEGAKAGQREQAGQVIPVAPGRGH